jgi:hypothetical protein
MGGEQVDRLLGLGVVIAVAVGAVLLLLRATRRSDPRDGEIVLGYPPDLFPVYQVTQQPALRALAATQARLLSVYRRLPAHDRAAPVGEIAVWLRVFLLELRQMMDTAYRVALVSDLYGHSRYLDQLVAEVQAIEAQIADDIARRLLGTDGPRHDEALGRRLALLRQCARELTSLEAAPRSAGFGS